MRSHLRRFSLILFAATGLWTYSAGPAVAQEVVANHAESETIPPASPAVSPGPMSLDACIEMGMKHQPSLDAARDSLAAAYDAKRGLDNMRLIYRPLIRDLSIRKQQACEGITIQEAAYAQAEWDARYAITRNFFTVQYVRAQQRVIDGVLRDLDTAYKRAKKLFESGDPEVRITKIDLDSIQVQISVINTRKAQADNGLLKATAALREAMGVKYDYPLDVANVPLPAAVTEIKTKVKAKDDKGITVETEVIEYRPVYQIDRDALIVAALTNRGELAQAAAFSRIIDLERSAQQKLFGPQGRTFAQGADIHVQPIPQGVMNGEYRPGAIGPEMPPSVAGPKADRVARVTDLFQRSLAVLDKATHLVSLDVEAQYLKWRESLAAVQSLSSIQTVARELPDRVMKLAPKDYTSSNVIQANKTAIEVQAELNEALHNHALALAGLERATAGAFRIYPAPK